MKIQILHKHIMYHYEVFIISNICIMHELLLCVFPVNVWQMYKQWNATLAVVYKATPCLSDLMSSYAHMLLFTLWSRFAK